MIFKSEKPEQSCDCKPMLTILPSNLDTVDLKLCTNWESCWFHWKCLSRSHWRCLSNCLYFPIEDSCDCVRTNADRPTTWLYLTLKICATWRNRRIPPVMRTRRPKSIGFRAAAGYFSEDHAAHLTLTLSPKLKPMT